MLKEKLNKVKELAVKDDGTGNKKKIENLVVFIILLIITVLAINFIWNDGKEKTEKNSGQNGKQLAEQDKVDENTSITSEGGEEELASKIKNILSKISGVGEVEVLITYTESSQTVAMYNENTKETSTEEKDDTGGTRIIKESDTQKDVIYQEENGEKKPITQKTIMPKIEGAIITAEGAADGNVKTNIIQAVEAVTGLATHKIQVFEMQEKER
ncbi:MAG TPA: hypothetical protein IAB70_02775 [Candidatus Merdicola faecigallinarum]|uniref:Stage III sporulation protein AG n=1 Tax=Candidatus Merdicola faecigallinarum TaxID=2840862 RepID=A0A9D1M0D5_9FIRM|nr:hypothetical protein [Candidatus Merdicola faecigallinarum]